MDENKRTRSIGEEIPARGSAIQGELERGYALSEQLVNLIDHLEVRLQGVLRPQDGTDPKTARPSHSVGLAEAVATINDKNARSLERLMELTEAIDL